MEALILRCTRCQAAGLPASTRQQVRRPGLGATSAEETYQSTESSDGDADSKRLIVRHHFRGSNPYGSKRSGSLSDHID